MNTPIRKPKKPTTQIVVKTQSSEELNKKLKSAIRTIDAKLKKLGISDSIQYRVSNAGSFKYNELDANTVNIHTCINIPYLLKAHGMLKRVLADYQESIVQLELEDVPYCIWMNVSVEDWIHDIEIRIKVAHNQSRILELNQAKTELYGFLSNEDKLFNTLTKLKGIL